MKKMPLKGNSSVFSAPSFLYCLLFSSNMQQVQVDITHPRSVHPPWNQKRAPLRFCCLEEVFSLDKMVTFQVQNVSFRECKSWKNFHAFGWFVASAHHNWCSPSNYTSAMIFPESDSNSLLQLHASQIQHQKKTAFTDRYIISGQC